MEEVISRISRKILEEKDGEISIRQLDFDYTYGQIKLDEANLCIFTVTGEEFTVYYRFLKEIYELANIQTFFQELIDKTINFKHAAWLDDTIIVTKKTIVKHGTEIKKTMRN